jgi:hypothetical protein
MHHPAERRILERVNGFSASTQDANEAVHVLAMLSRNDGEERGRRDATLQYAVGRNDRQRGDAAVCRDFSRVLLIRQRLDLWPPRVDDAGERRFWSGRQDIAEICGAGISAAGIQDRHKVKAVVPPPSKTRAKNGNGLIDAAGGNGTDGQPLGTLGRIDAGCPEFSHDLTQLRYRPRPLRALTHFSTAGPIVSRFVFDSCPRRN